MEEISSPSKPCTMCSNYAGGFAPGKKDWPQALGGRARLVKADPENASGWIHQSYSLHELKRTARL